MLVDWCLCRYGFYLLPALAEEFTPWKGRWPQLPWVRRNFLGGTSRAKQRSRFLCLVMDRESLRKLKQKSHPLFKCILSVLHIKFLDRLHLPSCPFAPLTPRQGSTAEPIRLAQVEVSQLRNCYCGRAVPIYHLSDQSYRWPDTPLFFLMSTSIPSAAEPLSYPQEKHSTLWAHMRIP